MREITQVLVTAVGLAFLLPLVTVAAFRFDLGIPFVAAIFLFVALFVALQDRLGGDESVEATQE